MQKFVIERNIPNIGQWSAQQLRDAASASCRVLREMAPEIQWLQSYVTDDKLYCVYLAERPELIREHGVRGRFPVDAISPVRTLMDPTWEG